ncbi:MAG: transcriptional regulator NrdR, partial [Spirochaetaceae bacterium]|nr:transcriptional regulator NrdR [Spirochaetaceae bacterium]
MRCPYCGNLDDKVIDSRSLAGGSSVRRRRECSSCGARFTSYERIEERP